MFLILTVIGIIGMVVLYCKSKDTQISWGDKGFGWIIFSSYSALLWMMCLVFGIVFQNMDLAKLEMTQANRPVIVSQYQAIGDELKVELGKYLTHEQRIYESIGPKEIDIYLTKYPELHSHETVILLTENLKELHSKIYQYDIDYNKIVKNIKIRKANSFIWGYIFLPDSKHVKYQVN